MATNYISGMVSGLDWQSVVTSLINAEHKRVDLVTSQKTTTESKLKEWQSVNTKLLALKTAAEALNKPASFSLYTSSMTTDSSTVSGSDLMSVSTGIEAVPGSYDIKITNLAQAQKLSSNPFTSKSTALGSNYAGDFLINGKKVSITATDSLSAIATKINNLNSGDSPTNVTASVISYGTNDFRLILTSDKTGSEGISLANGSSANLLQAFGWKDNQAALVKNEITNGVQSDRFTDTSVAIQSLVGLTTGEAGSITIGDKSVTINLATMSLTDIKDAINTEAPTGVRASIISQTDEDGKTYYRLQIDGTQAFTDTKNILNTLGILDHGSTAVSGKISSNSITTDGAKITGSTLLKNIDGYNTFTAGDKITLSGTKTDGTPVNGTGTYDFAIESTTTIQDLLDKIKLQFGNVLAYVTSDGKIRVDDLSGGSSLSITLTSAIQDTGSSLNFGAFGAAAARKREIVAGEDATLEVDGVAVTRSGNTIDDVISGVTLNLTKEDDNTTISLNISRDADKIKSKVQDFVTAYNAVRSYINTQFKYDTTNNTKGGVLFGDGTLSSVKSDLVSRLTQSIPGVNSRYSTFGLVGITMDSDGLLTIGSTFTDLLKTNFSDIQSLFTVSGSSTRSELSYNTNSRNTKAGDYTVHITTAATQGTATTGTVDLSSGGATGSLTIMQNSGTAAISISSDMDVEEITQAINAELDKEYTQKLVGSALMKQDDGVTAISAQTSWDHISGTTPQNKDIISFSGTTRTGTAISGSYTISDTSSDTVQGLLSAIEEAFSNQVTAGIDSSGRITVTDNNPGTSQLSFDISEPEARGLDFGTVLANNSGGVTGRHAIGVTASDDGSGHLILKNDSYGSASSFTIASSGLGLTDETVTGQDVAGTIGGEAATGSGQTLTGNSGNAHTDGLAVTYSGSTAGVDVGAISIKVGVTDLFSRVLFDITDSYEGYVAAKQNSLQDKIDDYKDKIDAMEEQLSRKQELLTNQFVRMETAMGKLQNQSSWLSQQTSTLSSNWK
jgi:flagellar hook-associated protein 2